MIGVFDDLHIPGWVDYADCVSADPEIFFPEKGGTPYEAQKICKTCPVRIQCLDWAMSYEGRGTLKGVWGGTTEKDRDLLRKKASRRSQQHRDR